MQNLQNELIDLLKHEDNLVIDGHLNKNKIVELALKVEPQLISLLIKNDTFKKHFFQEVENVLVFDKIKFQRFVNNKSFLPDSYTAFKNKIGLITNDNDLDNFISTSNEVVLAWPHKDCVLEGGQTKEDQKRNEIFWNETLAPDSVDRLLDPKVLTNFKKIDKDGVHKVSEFKGTENLIIKGNNLLSLSSLLKSHRSKVKLIYIDPPYNTGGSGDTFAYNNTFKRSSWLTFMKNRLVIAKKLLTDDGAIIVAIDDYEHHTLRFLLDEILGSDNRLGTVVVVHNPRGRNDDKYFATMHEYLLVYGKNKDLVKLKNFEFTADDLKQFNKQDEISTYSETPYTRTGNNSNKHERPNLYYPIYYNQKSNSISLTQSEDDIQILPINAEGEEKTWRWGKDTFELKKNTELLVKKVKGEYKIFKKRRPDDIQGRKPRTVWNDSKYDASSNGIMLLRTILGKNEFSYPKSLYAVMDIIKILSNKNDIILDFFAGSGTTAQAVLELNKEDGGTRKFVMCEQMDYVETVTTKRIQKVIESIGNDSFVYVELMKYNQKYIDLIQIAETKEQLINVWNEMQETAFLSYQFDKKTFNERLDAFKTATIEDMKQYLIEVLDKNQLYVNYSEINDETFNVSYEDKKLNEQFYSKK